jgi:hypothetical protein
MNIENNLKILLNLKKLLWHEAKVILDFLFLDQIEFFLQENAIPLSIFLRQKHDVNGLADLRPNSGMNPTYQAYFEALLTTDQNEQQHPTDKAAVVKYIRRRERRKRAEENKKNRQITDDVLEKVFHLQDKKTADSEIFPFLANSRTDAENGRY